LHNAVQQIGERDIMPVDLIEFTSTGRLFLIATEQQAASLLPHLELLQVTSSTQAPESITGYLGDFNVELAGQSITVDLVLDLQQMPSMKAQVLPLGYFAPKDDKQALAEALQQLPDLIGSFDKPRYFNYKPSICAHSRRQLQGCSNCIDACPADAIISLGDEIEVNPYLCQGCGSCTATCPSGAISYALPTLDVSVNRIRAMLQGYFDLEMTAPHIVIHDLEKGEGFIDVIQDQLSNHIIAFSIEEIGALGMPFWMSALAYGAAKVTVLNAGTHSDHDWLALQQEIDKTNEMLIGIGYADDKVSWLEAASPIELLTYLNTPLSTDTVPSAVFGGIDDKRRMTRIAYGHLAEHAPQTLDVLTLSQGAAFGEVQVDTNGCTLCHSCVSVCPEGALLDGGDQPQLNFIEDLCVQCGLCETACPEKVISLSPQYLFDQEQSRKMLLLHDDPIFNCIRCNKGFATRKMIDTMTNKLKSHPMFQGHALERLKMCEDCRVKAMFKEKGSL
jgi:ferredoxin